MEINYDIIVKNLDREELYKIKSDILEIYCFGRVVLVN